MISKEPFGKLPDGRTAALYTIRNQHGEFVELLDFGASIHSLFVRDSLGSIDDIVLGVANASELGGFTSEGATYGRCANRIAFGQYEQDGKIIQLETEANGHFLHSGSGNYAYRLFQGEIDEKENSVSFTLHENGEGGFGCAADATIRYRFGNDHRLEIHYGITPEGDTIINPTNHAFFNLSGTADARDHLLRVYARNFAPKGDIGMPVGEICNVKNTPMDFRPPRTLRDGMQSDEIGFFGGKQVLYDDCFIFDKSGFGLGAELVSPANGRTMRVYTDMPAMVLFTPTFPLPGLGKPNKASSGYSSLCLETGFVPNAINCPKYDSPLCRKGQKFTSNTVFEFDRQ